MACSLGNKCAKNLCKRTVLVQLIIKNVVTFFGTQSSRETFQIWHVGGLWQVLNNENRNTSNVASRSIMASTSQRKINCPFKGHSSAELHTYFWSTLKVYTIRYFSKAKLFLIALLRNNYLSPKCIGD